MKDQSDRNSIKAVTMAVSTSVLIYIILSLLGIYMFGSSIKPDLLDNIGEERYTWESIVLSISFLIVIVCHIPFIFFVGKEHLLILIDEIDRKSISTTLDQYLTSANNGKLIQYQYFRLLT